MQYRCWLEDYGEETSQNVKARSLRGAAERFAEDLVSHDPVVLKLFPLIVIVEGQSKKVRVEVGYSLIPSFEGLIL